MFERLKKLLCKIKIHWTVIEGGGIMGDAWKCLSCDRDKYPEVFGGIVIHVIKKENKNGSNITN